MNGGVHFASVNGDFLWSFNSQANFVASDLDDRNDDVLVDHDAFIFLTRQNQHDTQLSPGVAGGLSRGTFLAQKMRTANPAAASVISEQQIERTPALTRGSRILRRAALRNQATERVRALRGNDFRHCPEFGWIKCDIDSVRISSFWKWTYANAVDLSPWRSPSGHNGPRLLAQRPRRHLGIQAMTSGAKQATDWLPPGS